MISDWILPRKKLLLDANLLVVVTVGLVAESIFGSGPVSGYRYEDFLFLRRLIAACEETVVTPYILAEVNSLLNKTGFARKDCRSVFAEAIIPAVTEHYIESRELALNSYAMREFGLADTSIIHLADPTVLILSADGPLVGYLKGKHQPALHYEEIRHLA